MFLNINMSHVKNVSNGCCHVSVFKEEENLFLALFTQIEYFAVELDHINLLENLQI